MSIKNIIYKTCGGILLLIFSMVTVNLVAESGISNMFDQVSIDEQNNNFADFRSADSAKVVEIRSFGADLSYDVTEIRAKAGEKLTIRFINESDMPHNVVVVKTRQDINPVGIAALDYSKSDYIPENEMDKIISFTKLARPGETVEVTFTVPSPGTYPYICTYPGHFTLMQGDLISTE